VTRIIILDANLLLLLVVGATSRDYIAKHRRLSAYTEADFDLLGKVLATDSKIVVTPNILTETSNLIRYIANPARTQIYRVFRTLVQATEEQYLESRQVVSREEFIRLGLTDSAMLEMATASHILLTADLALYLAALRQGLQAQNFNHLRDL
jgi:hypothetical protein